eukprot:NODE_684_length_5217_cov_0.512505.p1 type:complete len:431 gc:universal NODE_684_length_5217_cov_0.512505:2217-925(-)
MNRDHLERIDAVIEKSSQLLTKRSHKQKNDLIIEHQVYQLLQEIQKLPKIESDEPKSSNALDSFYKEYNNLVFVDAPAANIKNEFEMEINIDGLFSGEECFGRYLDLHSLHREYLNLPNVDKINYLKYLDDFYIFNIHKHNAAYKSYLVNLNNYLFDFLKRVRPLHNWHEELDTKLKEFKDLFYSGKLKNYEFILVELSKETLFCQTCNKVFTNENVFKNHLDGKKHLSNLKSNKLHLQPDPFARLNPIKEIAILQHSILYFINAYLKEVVNETKINNYRKQTNTHMNEDDELRYEGSSSEEEMDMNDNPMKLPLGWDGTPIPIWLYKLHGLNKEFECEICGNFIYLGRRNFDRHFTESRHAYGMRSLGIPNTKHFSSVVKIEEALELYEKIKVNLKSNKFDENDEEFEDEDGNVYNKKTFEDLKMQGLI